MSSFYSCLRNIMGLKTYSYLYSRDNNIVGPSQVLYKY